MKVTVIGGAGFIGCNAAEYYLNKGYDITIFDNLSRKGSAHNLSYLLDKGGMKFVEGDITNDFDIHGLLESEMADSNFVLHLAAQVAVTTSVANPREDFNTNALGTFNILESIRRIKGRNKGTAPILLYSSTNKVYGGMEDILIVDKGDRYDYLDLPEGISENRQLDFHSPYGCSKGCGDQYVKDYSKIFGLDTVVLRQSCIYGKRQFGVEDQGWVAWFTIANILNKPITIFGDGKQVRDVLWIDDLLEAYDTSLKKIKTARGKCYNIGGGKENKMSLHQLIKLLEDISGKKMDISYAEWRPGDQKLCFMDVGLAKRDLSWEPRTNIRNGIERLYSEIEKNKKEVQEIFNSC